MRMLRAITGFLAAACIASAAESATPIGTIPIGNTPYGLAVDVAGAQAVVVNLFPVKNPDGTDGPNVRVLDLAGRRELRAFKVGTRLVSVALAGTSALVVNEDQDAVRLLDINAGAQIGADHGGQPAVERRRAQQQRRSSPTAPAAT